MRDIVAWTKQGLKQPAIRRVPFKGIVQDKPKTITEMTYKELRAMAKDKGIKGTLKREEYIALLTNA
jgi:hypothetical protein